MQPCESPVRSDPGVSSRIHDKVRRSDRQAH
jgi:hypothetical protein